MPEITMLCGGAWRTLTDSLASAFGAKPVAEEEITCPLCKGHFKVKAKGISKIQFKETPDMNMFNR
jgi:hypothetical protein